MSPGERWLVRLEPRPNPSLRLVTFPPAGAGAAICFPWSRQVPEDIEVWAARLPGRESRIAEPLEQQMDVVVSQLAAATLRLLDRPFVLLGHSLGALLAYLVALNLKRASDVNPALLIVSGREAPNRPDDFTAIAEAPDRDFIAAIQALGGLPDHALEPELLQLWLPALRADFRLCASFAAMQTEPLACPVVAWRGERDPTTTPEGVREWRAATTSWFQYRAADGDHFFPFDARTGFLETAIADIRTAQLTAAGPGLR